MSNVEAQIKPTGLSQRNLVDVLYMIVYSIQGLCQKLDDDDSTDDTYEASVFTAIFNGSIEDGRGNSIQNRANDGAGTYVTDDRFFIIKPTGVTMAALNECFYQIFDMLETLTEQIDADDVSSSTYEALCYTAKLTWIIENRKGSRLGNGTAYYFGPNGMSDQRQLVDLICKILDALETICETLDTDAVPAGSDYEALWFTATVLLRVQDSLGLYAGNDITVTP
jgi:hypothetical protein